MFKILRDFKFYIGIKDIKGKKIRIGDTLKGLPSGGFFKNGYEKVRLENGGFTPFSYAGYLGCADVEENEIEVV